MCGIAGYIAPDVSPLRASETVILESLRYRGRDGSGVWSDDRNVTLLHTRLSIIDLAGGAQPMVSRDGAFALTFNGEIYNYKELRTQYEALGARFESNSDTEVVLHGFALKGAKVLDDLNGMFAFAIWNAQAKTLFLARDRLGKKPLFWTQHRGAFLFSSTIDSFRRLPDWDDRLSAAGLAFYSFQGGFPYDRTAYQNARAVPAGCLARIKPGSSEPKVEHYWRPNYARKSGASENALLDEYESLLTDAVRIRLRSDVPLALSFSGGVDSGTIAALAQKLGASPESFTIDYHAKDDPSEEVIIAEQVAAKLNLKWTFIQYDYRTEILEGLAGAYQNFDQPCQQLALVYSQRLYERMKPFCTVVLSGNAADEMFTGYIGNEEMLAYDQRRAWAQRAPMWLKNLASKKRQISWENARQGGLSMADWSRADAINNVATFTNDPSVLEECADIADILATEYQEAGVDTQLDLVMHRGLIISATDSNYRLPDITGYAAQIEVRSPYLDYRMVEFAARLPARYKIGRRDGQMRPKYLPRKYYERLVGPEIAWAKKKGMGANLSWHLEFARNTEFYDVMTRAFDCLSESGYNAQNFREARDQFCADFANGDKRFTTAGIMMNGFMFGSWLSQTHKC